jgi:Tfp pilus tip-associated adhesin PilY1
VEKTVGETWSDPAVGQLSNVAGDYEVLVGSGFLAYSREQQANRGGVPAGTTFYILAIETGLVHGWRTIGADNFAEKVDNCAVAGDCTRLKNALQMDPVATGPSDSRFITKAYIGDLDGKVWRFDLSTDANGDGKINNATQLYDAGATQPLFASMATVAVGGSNQYIFVGTGSDLLPSVGVNNAYSLLVLLDNGGTATKTAEILLATTDGIGDDEKVTAFPAVAGDIVFFSTTTYKPQTPCTPFSATLYAFTFIGGPAYDTNGDGRLTTGSSGGGGKKGGSGSTSGDSVKVATIAGERATAPFIVDQHLVFGTGSNVQMFGDPQDFNNGVGQVGVRILSWRNIQQ